MSNAIKNTFRNKMLSNVVIRKRIIVGCLQAILAVGSVVVMGGVAQADSGSNCAGHITDPTCN
ncbi:hypothetical protein [Pseudomonas sp. GM102]|uniref:hypothetical protein n=1 Tax=Pseudomonas sp. GM102 TaxID=1144321 RepID=UPI0012F8FAE7|nr:hypothetical protein [Pseudomonas sp. GM102]